MDFVFENMVAINFIHLDNARACEVLEARNAVSEFMLTSRKISKKEHFAFINSLKKNKNSAYFAVYENDCKVAESSLDSATCTADSACSKQEANSSITDEFLGFCEASDKDRTLSPSRKRDEAIPKKSLRDEFADSQNLLGVVCFNAIDLANKNAFFGIYSNGNNNGAKLLQILRFLAFERLNLHILYAKVLSTNARAIRFYEKNGFVRCGRLIEAFMKEGKFIDLEIWALKNSAT